jgi:hypothetical protein
MRVAWAIVLLAPLATAGPAPATTATVEVRSASADLAFVSREGCVQNEISIIVHQTTVRPGASQDARTETHVSYSRSRFDFCEGVDLGTDLGSSRTALFSGDLNRARLDVSIDGVDASQSTIRISFSLTWNGTGNIQRAGRSPSASPDAKAAVHTVSQSRNAWVEGRVDGQDVSGATIAASLQTTREQAITR